MGEVGVVGDTGGVTQMGDMGGLHGYDTRSDHGGVCELRVLNY